MEITGFIVFSASSNGADINSECGTEESDVKFTRKIKEAIGEGTRLTHLSRPTVSIFRDLSNIDEIRDLTKEETRESQLVKRKLRPNEILFVKGSVRIEIEVPTRGSFI
ncbi:hypothetical protein N7524_006413 [Penicillium chrysogenum]|nr:hypothetical protein N7524_006413 [Penicillium chrysogenum]